MRLPSSLCMSPPESQKCSFWVGDPEPGCLPRGPRGGGQWLLPITDFLPTLSADTTPVEMPLLLGQMMQRYVSQLLRALLRQREEIIACFYFIYLFANVARYFI